MIQHSISSAAPQRAVRANWCGRALRSAALNAVVLFALAFLLTFSWTSSALAACTVGGNNVKCDTCAELNNGGNGIVVPNSLSLPGSNNNFCEVTNLELNQTIRFEIDGTKEAPGLPRLDFDIQQGTNVSGNPTPFVNIDPTTSPTTWDYIQRFTNDNGTQTVNINAMLTDINQSAPPNKFDSVTTCFCEGGTPPPEKTGSVIIEKATTGGDSSFEFDPSSNLNDNNNFNLSNAQSITFTGLEAGEYTVQELISAAQQNAGWFLDDTSVCVNQTGFDGSSGSFSDTTATITINESAGDEPTLDTVKCTFENVLQGPTGEIKIVKVVEGGTDTFDFLGTSNPPGVGVGPFQLTASPTTSDMRTFSDAVANIRHIITETVPDGWVLTDIQCINANGEQVETERDGGSIEFFLATPGTGEFPNPDNKIQCTFTNEFQQTLGKIIVRKETIGGDDEFDFNLTGPETDEPFQLNGGDEKEFSELTTGSYMISELDLPAGWNLTDIDCGQGERTDNKITVELDPDETISCTFTNERQRGNITVRKETIGGDNEFDFNLMGPDTDQPFQLKGGDERKFSELTTGSYMISELDLPEGWNLKNIDCGQGERADNKITVDLDADESIECTFTNFKERDDRMEDVVKLYNYRNLKNLLEHGPDRSRIIRRLDQQQQPSLKDTPPLKYSGDKGTASTAGTLGTGATLLSGAGSSIGVGGGGAVASRIHGGSSLVGQQLSAFSRSLGLGSGTANYPGAASAPTPGALPFGLSGSVVDNKFTGSVSISLSQLREHAGSEEARKIAEAKAYGEALGLDGNPYGVVYDGFAATLTPQRLDVWAEYHRSHYDDGLGGIDRDGDFNIFYIGVDYTLSPSLLIGFIVQFDSTDEDVDDDDLHGKVEGDGWMVGPYVGARLTDHLYFTARGAWGKSDNDIDLTDDAAGYRTGEFDTDRWLATAELIGNWTRGQWRFTPSVELAYGNQDQEAFRNSLGQTIGSNDITIGQLTFGPEFGYSYTGGDGTVYEPHISLEGIWNFDSDDIFLSDGTVVDTEELSGRVTGGIIIRKPNGFSMRIVGEYTGIGDNDFDSYGAQIWMNWPLQRR